MAIIKFLIGWIILSVSIHGCFANAAQNENSMSKVLIADATPNVVPEQLIVVFVEGTSEERIKEINKILKVKVLEESFGTIYLIEVPKGKSTEELREQYASFKEEVKAVNPNFGLQPQRKMR